MKVEFTFNTEELEAQGYKLNDIHNIIKKNFEKKGIPCVSDSEVLAFADSGGKYDFSNMWNIITGLMNTKWFKTFSTSCNWYDDDDSEAEDVLEQAWKFEKMLLSKLKDAEKRAEKEGWISAEDLENELGIID